MTLLVITGTGTEVGKTVATAAVAALALDAGKRVAVVKPAQTGVRADEPGDVDEVVRLAGDLNTLELSRYDDALSPEAAARRARLSPVRPTKAAEAAAELTKDHDVVLVEGAGGLLVRLDHTGGTLADIAWNLRAPVLLVAAAGLGTLNMAALTAEALRHRGIECLGVLVGSWPAQPDLATRSNLLDLPVAARAPLLGVLPEGIGKHERADFLRVARAHLAPQLGGEFDAVAFAEQNSA
ncbi:dethiobiotin synthase [Allokutzneria sp. A3M-2-11 16]|uniref:dethiobiotin synthase n=1 Tax=Allokutzneria sp. A3M-2-11 16 TaxID=2962043 RepID=UPI0020B8CB25|nr:dethiobiotin synthase [Allokutzneria sp. A3M-2-11 16]MCP3797730.1 dethiobiotin synthase [Allokutzneria sp. A3M-2-11 16]